MFDMPDPDQTRRALAREMLAGGDAFGTVLILILVTIITFSAAEGSTGQMLSVVLSGGTLLFVLYTAGAPRRVFHTGLVVVAVAIATTTAALLLGDTFGASTAGLVGLMLAIVAPIVILRRIITSPTITFRLVLGALSIYLLLGLAYTYLFALVSNLSGTPFFVQTDHANQSDFIYFSYTTLATIGYGDYTAASNLGRMLAVSEGLVGQLYLVSAVALLVGNIGRQLRAPVVPPEATQPTAGDEASKQQ